MQYAAVIDALCIGAFLLQAGYLAWLIAGTPTHLVDAHAAGTRLRGKDKADATSNARSPITVVVALRNERDRLPALAKALRAQTHSEAHIVWVNDHSTDGTARWLDAHAAPRSCEQVLHHEGNAGKKEALHAGIQAAPTELLAFTDADCALPPNWLATLAGVHASINRDTVLIGSSLYADPHGLLQRLAGYETWTANIAMLAAAQHGSAYMAVGRNLSYSASVYERVGGYRAHVDLLSGDDDLFVQAARNAEVPCRALWDARAHVPTKPPTSWRGWLRGQRRHTSTGRAYAAAPAAHLTAYYVSALLLYLAPLLVGSAGIGLLALRTIGVAHLLYRAESVLHQPAPMLLFPLWDAAHTVLRIGASVVGVLAPPSRWS